jgi:hypothetical protein
LPSFRETAPVKAPFVAEELDSMSVRDRSDVHRDERLVAAAQR